MISFDLVLDLWQCKVGFVIYRMNKPIHEGDANPICLPAGEFFPDLHTNATVVGMGWRWEPERECNTISGGPSEFSPCKFPFIDQHGHKVDISYLLGM